MRTRTAPCQARGFTLLEVLVSLGIMAMIFIAVLSVMNLTSSSYRRTMGRLDSFETARIAFDSLSRTLRQATLLSLYGYDDPVHPTRYQLKSDLHFYSGPHVTLGLNTVVSVTEQRALEGSHALFFQAPLRIVDTPDLHITQRLLSCTGYFIGYGDDPIRPAILNDRIAPRYRYRLYQWMEPRESMSVYEHTLGLLDSVPVSNPAFSGNNWFAPSVNTGKDCRPLADNVIALFIIPARLDDQFTPTFLWNSRDTSSAQTLNRLPDLVMLLMVVIDEQSAVRLGNSAAPPLLLSNQLFSDPTRFEADFTALESQLANHSPTLNFRIFKAAIPLGKTNTTL